MCLVAPCARGFEAIPRPEKTSHAKAQHPRQLFAPNLWPAASRREMVHFFTPFGATCSFFHTCLRLRHECPGLVRPRKDSTGPSSGAPKPVRRPLGAPPEGELRAGRSPYVHENAGLDSSLGGNFVCNSFLINDLLAIRDDSGLAVGCGTLSIFRLAGITAWKLFSVACEVAPRASIIRRPPSLQERGPSVDAGCRSALRRARCSGPTRVEVADERLG